MRLRELEAFFSKYHERAPDPSIGESVNQPNIRTYARVELLAEADGVWFLCPLCMKTNNGPVGTHMVMVGFIGAPASSYCQNSQGQDTRWTVRGTGLDDLALSPSIQLLGGCNWHGFVGSSGVPPGHAA